MAERRPIRHYRIGEYAQKMGVTPDLLKHYEKMGLIQAYTTESGYRYYPFNESVPLLECLSLRNYGVPLQEMGRLLYDADLQDVHEALNRRAEAIEKQIQFSQAVLDEHRKFSAWMERMRDRTVYGLLEEREAMYFLPHSKKHDFLDDARIQQVLSEWIDWMPLVKSCRVIPWSEEQAAFTDSYWGLAIPVSLAERYALPLNDAVELFPGGRQLVCHYKLMLPQRTPDTSWKPLSELAQRMGVKPCGPMIQVALMNLHIKSAERLSCGWYAMPVDE